MFNQTTCALGNKRSTIREIFEYAKIRAEQIGAENVFDFSIGNPSVPAPALVNQTIKKLLDETPTATLHGYTSAQGDKDVRERIAKNYTERFGVELCGDDLYMTCGAAASLTISLRALFNPGDECVLFAPFFTEYRVFIANAGAKIVVSKPEEKSEAQSPDEKKEDEMLSPAFVPTPEGESGDFSDFRTALNKLTKQFRRK